MTDPIADMLTRIRNAQMAKKSDVFLPFSKIKLKIAEILKAEGYITAVEKVESTFPEIKITLKYTEDQKAFIRAITRISKGGRRVYVTKDKLPRVLNGLGVAVLSTSQGIVTNKQAYKLGVGGEVLCEVY